MYRRRQEEIQKDYWLCKKYIDSHPRVSIKEIAKAVHLSENKFETKSAGFWKKHGEDF